MVWMVAFALAGCGLAAALATLRISAVAAPFVKTAAADLPALRVGLVLGCSPTMSDGRSNSFFVRRIAAAAELYRAGRVKFLLLSGDHSRPDYDEPGQMRRALILAGVPASRLVLDYAGFRTLDSVVRAKDVFGLRQVIIVSQHFHNERAVYLARAHGLEAFGFDAVGVGGPEGLRMAAREAVSRVFAVLDARVFHTRPRFDGPTETVGAGLLRTDGERVDF
jgi:SanA protein